MVWIYFKDEERQKAIKGFEHETKRKTPSRKTEIKMGGTG
jgi:hypothetical protein